VRSSNRTYLYPVDQLRAGAAILVVLYHSTQLISRQRFAREGVPDSGWLYSHNPVKTIVFEGHTGVALFMVLSGFIFTVGTLGEDVAYLPFLRNRLLRIYPLYLLVLLVGASTLSGRGFTLGAFTTALLPLSSFGPVAYAGSWGAMFWAVAIEVQFYLIFPLLLKLLNRNGPMALIRIIALVAILRTFAWMQNPAINLNVLTYYSLAGRIDQFLLGMLAAVVFIRYRHVLTTWLLAASTIGVVAALWLFNQLHGYAHPGGWRVVWVDLEGALWACFIASYVSVFERRKGQLASAVAAVGERSYSVYLLHFVIVSWVAGRTHLFIAVGGTVTGSMLTGLVVVVPIAVAAGFVSFSAIERPFLSLRGRYVREAEPVEPAPVLASELR
jgi:peptidoglycan/LPS O-acetylase OafA/YrhL